MKTLPVDARRYVWCRTRALWIIGMPVRIHLEDVQGAHRAGQGPLLRFAARRIGESCAVALNLVVNYERPTPPPALRGSRALEQLQGHALREPCWELFRGIEGASDEEMVERCEDLVARVRTVVGEMPDILSPEGHYPAIAMAREWMKLLEAVGEEVPVPYTWMLPT